MKDRRIFPLRRAISSSRCSTGGSCSASESARAGCHREARSAFVSRPVAAIPLADDRLGLRVAASGRVDHLVAVRALPPPPRGTGIAPSPVGSHSFEPDRGRGRAVGLLRPRAQPAAGSHPQQRRDGRGSAVSRPARPGAAQGDSCRHPPGRSARGRHHRSPAWPVEEEE